MRRLDFLKLVLIAVVFVSFGTTAPAPPAANSANGSARAAVAKPRATAKPKPRPTTPPGTSNAAAAALAKSFTKLRSAWTAARRAFADGDAGDPGRGRSYSSATLTFRAGVIGLKWPSAAKADANALVASLVQIAATADMIEARSSLGDGMSPRPLLAAGEDAADAAIARLVKRLSSN